MLGGFLKNRSRTKFTGEAVGPVTGGDAVERPDVALWFGAESMTTVTE